MGINIKATATNNADWNMQIQATDSDTGNLIDFTGAAVRVQVKDASGCLKLDGSIDNGKVTLPSAGVIEWLFPDDDMRGLCAGQYNMGGVYELNGEVVSLFTGELSVIDGVATL